MPDIKKTGDGFPSAGESCVYCGLCARKCPVGAITVDRESKLIFASGPAGENLVTSAVVSVASNQVFGRGGFGAVFGSKNLKAVVVTGKGRIKVANPMGLLELNQ